MSVLWTWAELCEALGAPISDGPAISGISIDSRTASRGDVFIALPGDPGPRFNPSQRSDRDGHDFVPAAVDAGAAGIVCSRTAPVGVPAAVVDDTMDALWRLGAASRRRMHGSVFAITGSSGKTTAKTLLAAALDAYASPGSLNNHLGVPLSLARMPADTRFGIFEIGTNHPGEIAPLSDMVAPNVACVLNVHPAHIGNFDSFDALVGEKLSISSGLSPGGVLVLEASLPAPDTHATIIRHGVAEGADFRLRDVGADGSASIETPAGRVRCHVPGGGEHRARTLTAVMACLHAAGESAQNACDLPDDLIPAGRGAVTIVRGIRVVDDSYNANPESMRQALLALSDQSGTTVAILGDMAELGDLTESAHADMAASCDGIDGVICVGSQMRALYDRLDPTQRWGIYGSVGEADPADVASRVAAVDTVLIKGSNGIFWQHGYVAALIDALGVDGL